MKLKRNVGDAVGEGVRTNNPLAVELTVFLGFNRRCINILVCDGDSRGSDRRRASELCETGNHVYFAPN